MNIQPNAAAASSIAGTSRAAARGGEEDAKRDEGIRQQSTADAPGGKKPDSSAIDSGEQTSDRGGDGRQMLDTYESSHEQEDEEQSQPNETPRPGVDDSQGANLDLQA